MIEKGGLAGAGREREQLRMKGQFWTPAWMAEAMVGYVVAGGSPDLFDPAVGQGAFFRAARVIGRELGRSIRLLGTEIDPGALSLARQSGLSDDELSDVEIADFVLRPPSRKFKAIVANPPYIRHHRLSKQVKSELKAFAGRLVREPLDGRAGLHIYFLLRALELLDRGGRLAFILPADTCEGVFSATLWKWITENYRLEAVITFTAEATPFPNIDTNPVVILIRAEEPGDDFLWLKCDLARIEMLRAWMASGLKPRGGLEETICRRAIAEGLATGFSRAPAEKAAAGPVLGEFAKVLRGIATGANEFFFMTGSRASELEIPEEFLTGAIGRTRDVTGDVITPEAIRLLDGRGRPTLLFSPDGRPADRFPEAVRRYIEAGERLGINERPLISTRRPWYKMETRSVPPILFAYLGRRDGRFIRNLAGLVPLTGFLCVYPREDSPEAIERLWRALTHRETLAKLQTVGKSYGSGAIKVEPRQLERLPLDYGILS